MTDENKPMAGELVTTRAQRSVLNDMADRYGMEPTPFEATIRAIAMPPNHTREEFAAFLLIAKEYRLNPLTKEIYAFPKRGGGIVPIVSIDGWVSLVNSHPQCDGFTFSWEQDDKGEPISCTCTMHRKDRSHPITVTEYLAECIRATDPWKMKHRMLRHKALIQAARYAFGFSGIYDQDEGEVIATSRDISPTREEPPVIPDKSEPASPPTQPASEVGAPSSPADLAGDFNSDDSGVADEPIDLMAKLTEWLETAKDEATIEEVWSDLDIESEFSRDPDKMARAIALKDASVARVNRTSAKEAGQGDLLDAPPPVPGER